jgi:voltage-gated potassium channel
VKQYNFVYIFAGVLVVLLIAPVMAELKEGNRHILQAGLDLSLLLGIWSVVGQRRWFIFGVILLLCGVSITITDAFLNLPELRLVTFVVVLPFYLLTAVLALRHVLNAKTVDSNILAGSICVYLLMGVIWAIVYSFVDYISPDSFSGMISETREDRFLGFLILQFRHPHHIGLWRYFSRETHRPRMRLFRSRNRPNLCCGSDCGSGGGPYL